MHPHLRERDVLIQSVQPLVVDLPRDRLGINESVDQLLPLLAQVLDLPLTGCQQVERGIVLLFILVEDNFAKQRHVLLSDLHPFQQRREFRLQLFLAKIESSTPAGAVVIGIFFVAPFRPASRDDLATFGAADERPQWEIWMMPLEGRQFRSTARQNGLNRIEQILVNNRFEIAFLALRPTMNFDPAGVDGIGQDSIHLLLGELLVLARAQSRRCHHFEDLLLCVQTGGEFLVCHPDEWCAVRIDRNGGIPCPILYVEVSDGSKKWPATKADGGLESCPGSLATLVVVELSERRQNAFHQFASWSFVNRFGDRPKGSSEFMQQGTDCEMVVFFASEPAQCIDHNDIDSPLVFAAVGQQLLKFGAVNGLGRLPFFDEDIHHRQVVALAVFATRIFLRREAQVFDLVFRGHPAVDDSSHGLAGSTPLTLGGCLF